MIHACVYAGQYNPVPIEQTDFETFGELCDSIVDLIGREYESKSDMLAWAPHRLREPYRKLVNVAEVTALALDIDAMPGTPEDLWAQAHALGIDQGLIYETPSSADDGIRVRVVLPVDRPHDAAECRLVRLAAAHAFGLDPVASGIRACTDASRLFFAGRLAGTPERRIWRW